MSNLLERTDVFVKSKRLERKSGKIASKLKFTSATKLSLQKNIEYDFLDKAINKLNTIYSEMISAVEIAEKVKAEEEARSMISGNKELESKIEEDEKIYKMTDAAIVNKRLKNVTIELLKLAGRIGTYKDNYGINVKKGFTSKSPKAINVQKLYANVYRSLMNKIDLYKMAEKKGLEVSEDGAIVTNEEDTPSWRKLFDNMQRIPSDVTVAMNKTKDEDEEVEMVQVPSNKITDEDKSYRKMLAQLGEEFALIDSYKKNTNGVPSQFKDGFESREQNLSKIFYDLTGVEIKRKNNDELVVKDNTEFQNLIDQVNGYKDPLTEKEHKEMEESLNEYYSRDEVASKISELNEKDVLYTFNQHMDDVIKAEIKENNKDAVDIVQESNENAVEYEEELEKQRKLAALKAGAKEQARMLKTLYDYIETRDKFEEEKREKERQERKKILDGAKEEAQRIHKQNVMIESAKEEAQRIHMQNLIIESAKEEAQRIHNQNIIAESAKEEAQRIHKQNVIIESAKEEAQRIHMQNIIAESAKEEAQRIHNQNMMADSKKEEAQRIHNQNMMAESAKEEAQRIHMQNVMIESAKEEAQRIHNQNVIAESAKEEANRIHKQNIIAESAKEEAQRILQRNNEYLKIRESARIEANILLNKGKKEALLKEAKALNERLKVITEEANKIDLSGAIKSEENVIDNSYDKVKSTNGIHDIIIKSAKEEAQRIFEQNKVLESAEKESQKIQERNRIIDDAQEKTQEINNQKKLIESAKEEAQRIHKQNVMIESAKEEANRIHKQNIIAESAKEEANRIHNQNIIAESAKEEANRIHNQNIIAESAKEEAQRIHMQNVMIESAKEEAQRIHNQNVIAESAKEEAQRIHNQNIMANNAIEETKKQIISEPSIQSSTTPVVNQVTPVTSQETVTQATPVVNQVVPVVNKTTTYGKNLQLLNNNDRYGELTKKSNALLVKKTRIDNITQRINNNLGNNINQRKEILTALKNELETENYSFLQRSENVDEKIPSTKVA